MKITYDIIKDPIKYHLQRIYSFYCINVPYSCIIIRFAYFQFFIVNQTSVNIHVYLSLHEDTFQKNLYIKA